jgi:hypothetical protein
MALALGWHAEAQGGRDAEKTLKAVNREDAKNAKGIQEKIKTKKLNPLIFVDF